MEFTLNDVCKLQVGPDIRCTFLCSNALPQTPLFLSCNARGQTLLTPNHLLCEIWAFISVPPHHHIINYGQGKYLCCSKSAGLFTSIGYVPEAAWQIADASGGAQTIVNVASDMVLATLSDSSGRLVPSVLMPMDAMSLDTSATVWSALCAPPVLFLSARPMSGSQVAVQLLCRSNCQIATSRRHLAGERWAFEDAGDGALFVSSVTQNLRLSIGPDGSVSARHARGATERFAVTCALGGGIVLRGVVSAMVLAVVGDSVVAQRLEPGAVPPVGAVWYPEAMDPRPEAEPGLAVLSTVDEASVVVLASDDDTIQIAPAGQEGEGATPIQWVIEHVSPASWGSTLRHSRKPGYYLSIDVREGQASIVCSTTSTIWVLYRYKNTVIFNADGWSFMAGQDGALKLCDFPGQAFALKYMIPARIAASLDEPAFVSDAPLDGLVGHDAPALTPELACTADNSVAAAPPSAAAGTVPAVDGTVNGAQHYGAAQSAAAAAATAATAAAAIETLCVADALRAAFPEDHSQTDNSRVNAEDPTANAHFPVQAASANANPPSGPALHAASEAPAFDNAVPGELQESESPHHHQNLTANNMHHQHEEPTPAAAASPSGSMYSLFSSLIAASSSALSWLPRRQQAAEGQGASAAAPAPEAALLRTCPLCAIGIREAWLVHGDTAHRACCNSCARALEDWFPVRYTQSFFEGLLSKPHVMALVVARDTDESDIVAAVTVRTTEVSSYMGLWSHQEAYIMTIGVERRHRRSGLASWVLAKTVEILAERGVSRLCLHVQGSNHGAIAFYAARGFRLVERLPLYYTFDDPSLCREALLLDMPLLGHSSGGSGGSGDEAGGLVSWLRGWVSWLFGYEPVQPTDVLVKP
eukprot:m51a1_g3256 putative n-alpha-acetyltransferase 60-like (871) ;mRNA; f:174362-177608